MQMMHREDTSRHPDEGRRESHYRLASPRVSEPILEVRNLIKHYSSVTAVDGLSLAVPEGICFGLLGPNGAGKTTTIEIMEGILAATSGEVRYRGAPLDQRFREEAGILFQKTALQDFLTVRQSITLFRNLYARGLSVDEVIRLCALEKLADRDNRKLSGGQQQRLLLAIALVNDPSLLFLDEPTTGLDPQARRNFWELIQSIKARKKTIILTTHYMDEAELLCDEIAIVDGGPHHCAGSAAAPAEGALRGSHARAAQTGFPRHRAQPAIENHRYGGTCRDHH